MDLWAYENYLFVPARGQEQAGTFYELKQSKTFEAHSFVIIPYQNPQVKAVAPQFFKVKSSLQIDKLPEASAPYHSFQLKALTPRPQYIEHVKQLKEHIQQGNIYEINYCVQYVANNVTIDPVSIFQLLNHLAKAPYAALLKLGDEFIISASPELFLEKKGNTLFTKPIKGTIKRGKTPEEDEQLKHSLYTSIKERTENVMAVDVARNDLSHFAKKATVTVNKLYNIETFETVHQMVSTVSCELKEQTTFNDIINATFPMASMTGAPKLRAMQLSDAFENFNRHYYSGTMGLIDANGDFSLSVIIRSIFYNQRSNQLAIAVGGAITYLSDPETEYEECLLKANALLRALNATIDA